MRLYFVLELELGPPILVLVLVLGLHILVLVLVLAPLVLVLVHVVDDIVLATRLKTNGLQLNKTNYNVTIRKK